MSHLRNSNTVLHSSREQIFSLATVYQILGNNSVADRTEKQLLDDAQYDYGNGCLLKLLGFTARQLSDLGKAAEPDPANESELQKYRSSTTLAWRGPT